MSSISEIIKAHRPNLQRYEELYKYFHANPELSFREEKTAAKIASLLQELNFDVFSNIGGHGVAAVLKNGEGKTVLLRADMDGLPVEELTGLEYASKARQVDSEGVEKPTMHACGHDMHITALLAAADALMSAKEKWKGTLVLVFQPAEEKAGGAQAMVDGGLYKKVPEPDVAVGGHVMPFRAGVIGTKRGLIASSADSFQLRIEGRQAHASMPHVSLDPIVQAASTIMRLQTIVSREVDPIDTAVVTVSAINAGDAENIIPNHADLKLNVRTAQPATRDRVLASMRRIIESEAQCSGNPNVPTLKETTRFPFLFNDVAVTSALEESFSAHFEEGEHAYTKDIPRLPGSEDFGILATSVGKPSCFFLYGGTDPEKYDQFEKEGRLKELPGNHSPYFKLALSPTLAKGVEGYVCAALTFLTTQ